METCMRCGKAGFYRGKEIIVKGKVIGAYLCETHFVAEMEQQRHQRPATEEAMWDRLFKEMAKTKR